MLSKKRIIFRWRGYARYFIVEKNPRLERNAGIYPLSVPPLGALPPFTPNVTSVFRVFTSVAAATKNQNICKTGQNAGFLVV